MARSFASVLRKTGGWAPAVAHARAVLVFAWIAFQSVRVTNGLAGAVFSPLWIVPFVAVPGLFALLGFCLAQAAADRPARDYLLNRLRRAGPVLLVAVTASALVLGPLLTTSSLGSYFADPAFALYFLNLAGWPRFQLPGTFEFNDYAEVVNEVLWLTPCFVFVTLFALLAMRARRAHLVAIGGAGLTLAVYVAGEIAGLIPSPTASVFRYSYLSSGLIAILAGQCGVLWFLWRERLPVGWPVLLGSLAVLGALALFVEPYVIEFPGMPVAIALLAIGGALGGSALRLPGSWIAGRAAPVLHGAMLFSFPLQQLAVDLGVARQAAVVNFAFSLSIAAALAWVLNWIAVRVGLYRARTEPDYGDIVVSLPDLRRPRFWRSLFRQVAGGLGVAVAVGAVTVIVILITIAALQIDPVGV